MKMKRRHVCQKHECPAWHPVFKTHTKETRTCTTKPIYMLYYGTSWPAVLVHSSSSSTLSYHWTNKFTKAKKSCPWNSLSHSLRAYIVILVRTETYFTLIELLLHGTLINLPCDHLKISVKLSHSSRGKSHRSHIPGTQHSIRLTSLSLRMEVP